MTESKADAARRWAATEGNITREKKKKKGVFTQHWDGGTGIHKFKVCSSLPVNYIMMQLIKYRLS